jgi:putative ABC transport system permease protein
VIKYAGASVTSALRAGGRTLSQSKEARGARNTLVIAQVALCVVLVISAGLMIRTFQALRQVEPGFSGPERLQVFWVYIPEAQVKENDRVLRMLQQMLDKVSAVPGVESAGFANSVPTDGNTSTDVLFVEGRDYPEGQLPPIRNFKYVAPGYFKAMGTRLVAGRDYTWDEIYARRDVSMISENMARELWHDPPAAVGKRIREGAKEPWREIVGVVQDVHLNGADRPAPAIVYDPALLNVFWANPTFVTRNAAFAIRSPRAGSAGFLKEIQQAVWSVNPDLPLATARTMEDLYRGSMARSSFALVMLAIAGGMALLLGVVGIYGVISYSVSQRTRELGIRIALGARPAELKTMVVGNGLSLAAIGVALGLIAAAAVSRVMGSLLFGVSATDPVTYLAVALGLLAVAAGASYLPAHRASAVNPVEALRAE